MDHVEGLRFVAFKCWDGATIVDNTREAVQQEVDLLVGLFDLVGYVNLVNVFLVKLGLNYLPNTLIAHLIQLIRDPRAKA